MTKETNKCPNCGHQFKVGEEYCPNCDLFIPINDQTDQKDTFDPNQTKQFKTFKEIEKEPTENYPESRFKHRNIQVNDKTEEQLKGTDITNELDETKETFLTEQPKDDSFSETSIETVSEKDVTLDSVVPTDIEDDTNLSTTPVLETNKEKDDFFKQESRIESSQSNNRKKILLGVSAAAVLAIGGYYVYSNEQEKSLEKDRIALVKSTKTELDSLFTSEDKVFLKNDIKQADFENAKKELDKLKTKDGYDDLKEIYDEAEIKFNKQEKMNDLFKTPVMVGKELKSEALVKDDSAISLTKITEEKDGFDILFNKAFNEAKKQKDSLAAINEKMAHIIKDDSVVKTATRKQYEEAEKLSNQLKDEEMKKEFKTKLKKVDTFLVDAENKKKEAEEAARIAEEQRLAEIASQNQNIPNTQPTAPVQPAGPGGDYKWGNREDSYIDYNDAAWAWNPGIQEKVIAEVISRGYVVEGGYSLVPKYIENGEGFYDLYATTNSKIFPKSKPEEFPLYVVTINVKTGWFKGNGPN